MTQFIDWDLPLKKVALFSSGVGFFERAGDVTGSAVVRLPFPTDDVSDALKSLTIMDPLSAMPSVTYPAEDTPSATLGSLKPDLTSNPGVAALLNAVRGARVEVTCASGVLTGRILGVEERSQVRAVAVVPTSDQRITARWDGDSEGYTAYLSLYDSGTVQLIDVATILGYRLLDQDISTDMERALDVLLGAATSKIRNLEVRLPADGTREVRLTYVTSSPVWKAAYRLDLAETPAFLQGWAIVDNASDVDWENVELSLFVGRPSSFTQPLYQPYYVRRQEIPLAIAGSAEARTYEGAYDAVSLEEAPVAAGAMSKAMGVRPRGMSKPITAQGKPAGEQFTFTFGQPVTLNRHQSAMLPLTQGDVTARKLSIFSGQSVSPKTQANPALGVEVVNTTGVSLPAGPITIFDDGLYAGDALMDFLPARAKRLLSYGDDMAVRGSHVSTNVNRIASTKLSRGVLTINVSNRVRTQYQFVNESSVARHVMVEHRRGQDEELVQPQASETTAGLYRFEIEVPANATMPFVVETNRTVQEEVAVVSDPRTVLTTYSPWGLPAEARTVLERAAEISERQRAAEAELASLNETESKLVADQARVRENLTVVGPDSRSGAGYLKRLDQLEDRLVELSARQDHIRHDAESAATELADYISSADFS